MVRTVILSFTAVLVGLLGCVENSAGDSQGFNTEVRAGTETTFNGAQLDQSDGYPNEATRLAHLPMGKGDENDSSGDNQVFSDVPLHQDRRQNGSWDGIVLERPENSELGVDVDGVPNASRHTGGAEARAYYVDALNGSDDNQGVIDAPWQTLAMVTSSTFAPGDAIYFKRGTQYSGCVTISGDGTEDEPIVIGAYGIGAAPRFTNPDYNRKTGNAMRIRGDYHIVEDLYFHNVASAPSHVSSFEEVWAAGALHIGLGSDHVIIRNNAFIQNPKAIQSYSEHSLISGNFIDGPNPLQQQGFLSKPFWGPIGIQLGIGNQEIADNYIANMYVDGGEYGADGGAIEIDDGRFHKDNIHIHGNTTHHNMGFLEVSYWDDIAMMSSSNMVIEYNTSRDYQSFLLWWAPTAGSAVRNNTIIRDDNDVEGLWNAVFILDEPPGDIHFHNNIIIIDNDQTEAVFSAGFNGAVDDVRRTQNCYWNVEGGAVDLGFPALGEGEISRNPLFVDYGNGDYALQSESTLHGWGSL